MATVSPHLSTVTLNSNGLNSPIKIYRMASEIKKKRSSSIQEHFRFKDTHRLKMNRQKIRCMQMVTKKKVGMIAFISDKIDF